MPPGAGPIIDTHQHLWDLDRFRLPWQEGEPEVLRRSYVTADYLDATRNLGVTKAVYMEVNVAPEQEADEAEHVIGLCRDENAPTAAAVIAARLDDPGFQDHLLRFGKSPFVRGVRQVLHQPHAKPGLCLTTPFVEGVGYLSEFQLHFDVCIRPAELGDAAKLADRCHDTRIIIDHCGNADPKAFMKDPPARPQHEANGWRHDMDTLAARPNVICKISGIVARAPKDWDPSHLAPIINHCLDAFGPDRVIFGSDWPVCLLAAPLRDWVGALREIVRDRPADEQRKLFHDNAARLYDLDS